jgi:ABC-type nitrate/sulfonate/bicarbonate transport system permease component
VTLSGLGDGLNARLRTFLQGLALPIVLLLLWEGAGRAELLPAGILPPPSTVLSTWQEWAFGSGGFGLNP